MMVMIMVQHTILKETLVLFVDYNPTGFPPTFSLQDNMLKKNVAAKFTDAEFNWTYKNQCYDPNEVMAEMQNCPQYI